MAIERVGDKPGGALKRSSAAAGELATPARSGPPAKKHAGKHSAKKHAAKHSAEKHAAKKHAAKHAADKRAGKKAAKHVSKFEDEDVAEGLIDALDMPTPDGTSRHEEGIARAFHHLQRAGAVISLLEHDSGGDLRMLLEHGIDLYRKATGSRDKQESIRCAHGLLRAAEHLGMAGLYAARADYRVQVAPPPWSEVAEHLERLGPRLDQLSMRNRKMGRRLEAMARELLRRAQDSSHDPHLEYELTMAADGICTALENGL